MNDLYNEDFLVCSASYRDVINNNVLPWLKAKEKAVSVPGCDGHPLYCVSYEADNPLATVMIVHGFTENAFKYAELIWSLLHLGFSVVAFDQRGHGRSWRDGDVHDQSVTHVDDFSEYVLDLRNVCDAFRPAISQPFFVFAHSMGGAVTALFLEQYRNVFAAAVLSSPMIAPRTGGLPAPLASAVGSFARILGRGKKHPFFMKPYSGPEDFSTSCATDPERFAWYDEIKAGRKEFQNSIPTWQWSCEAISVTEKILAPGSPEKITCPVLLCTAEHDFSVLHEPQESFIERVPSGRQMLVKGSRHEIFRSVNDVLFPWWHEVIGFYRANACGFQSKGEQMK